MDHLRTRITELFNIPYPIIQGGMIWAAGHRLASAVSNAGGLGLVGGGSMDPDLFRHHIRCCREETSNPFGVNIPLLYRHAEDLVITGIMTNMCCESTARDAYYRDYRVFFPADGTGSINEEMHLASLLNLSFGFAHITTADEIINGLNTITPDTHISG